MPRFAPDYTPGSLPGTAPPGPVFTPVLISWHLCRCLDVLVAGRREGSGTGREGPVKGGGGEGGPVGGWSAPGRGNDVTCRRHRVAWATLCSLQGFGVAVHRV